MGMAGFLWFMGAAYLFLYTATDVPWWLFCSGTCCGAAIVSMIVNSHFGQEACNAPKEKPQFTGDEDWI